MKNLQTIRQKFIINMLVFLGSTIFIVSCGSDDGNIKSKQTKSVYHAIYKTDTALLKLDLSEKAFTGQMEINYNGLYKDSGDVNGIIKGDTLKGTYYYQRYGIEKWDRIPIALLKRDSKLIMGVGNMEIYFNMTFFKKKEPIDYQHVKFIFEKTK